MRNEAPSNPTPQRPVSFSCRSFPAGSRSKLIREPSANAAPSTLLGLVGGVLVDRLDRKMVMIGSDVVRGVALFTLLFVNGDPSRLWLFFVVLAVTGAASTLFYPARASALPAIVSRMTLAGANALLEAGFVVALVFGALLAGVLGQQIGPNPAVRLERLGHPFFARVVSLLR